MSLNMAARDKQQQYSTPNVNMESHEMFPKMEYNQAQVNQCSSDTQGIAAQQKTTKRILILMALLVAMVLFISLAAIGLSIINYKASESLATTVEKNLLIQFKEVNRLNCHFSASRNF